jgi:hypothetical protein
MQLCACSQYVLRSMLNVIFLPLSCACGDCGVMYRLANPLNFCLCCSLPVLPCAVVHRFWATEQCGKLTLPCLCCTLLVICIQAERHQQPIRVLTHRVPAPDGFAQPLGHAPISCAPLSVR